MRNLTPLWQYLISWRYTPLFIIVALWCGVTLTSYMAREKPEIIIALGVAIFYLGYGVYLAFKKIF